MYIYVCVCMYIHMYMCVCICIYNYTYMDRYTFEPLAGWVSLVQPELVRKRRTKTIQGRPKLHWATGESKRDPPRSKNVGITSGHIVWAKKMIHVFLYQL